MAASDTQKQSRTLFAIGRSALTSLTRLRIAIVGMRGLGAEVAKNLILLGPGAIGLIDPTFVDIQDLGSNCFLRETDVGQRTRAEATSTMLRKLNPGVTVDVIRSAEPDSLDSFHLVILTDADERSLAEKDEYCRKAGKGFIAVSSSGAAGFVFVDFGPSFQILNRNGQDPRSYLIHSISDGEVYFLEDQVLDIRDGDTLRLDDVEGLKVNGREWRVAEVTSGSSVRLEGLETVEGTYVKGGLAKEVKYPEAVAFASWEECRRAPAFTPAAYFQDKSPSGKTRQLHLAYLALQRFHTLHGRLPVPLSDSEAQECLSLAHSLNSELSTVTELNEEYPRLLALYAALQPVPFATFWGGIVAQEAIKFTGSFRPLGQLLAYDWFPLVRKASDRVVVRDRYMDQTALFGLSVTKKLQRLNVFLVGAGALGCEYMKAFALMGVACDGGVVHVTDDDHIELSNLSRQFLFMQNHIGQAKSEVSAVAARAMNAGINVRARQDRVNADTQDIYTEEFWQGLDVVFGAVDNVKARLYIDDQCLWHRKPFLESGTKGLSGSSTLILPGLTKTYSDIGIAEDKQTANCTLKRFPHLPEHCIEWGRGMFESYFVEAARETEKFLQGKTEYLQAIAGSLAVHDQRVRLEQIRTIVQCAQNRTFATCVQLARDIFQVQMNNEIRQLLHALPADHRTADGGLFWASPKRVPHPLAFDLDNESVLDLIVAAANLYADVIGIPQERDRAVIKELARKTHELAFVPVKAVINTSTTEPTAEVYEDDEAFIRSVRDTESPALAIPLKVLAFEKDDESNFHIDFIHAISSLRCANYDLPVFDRMKTKLVAGKIIPAVTTSGATITGSVLIELYKYLLDFPRQDFRSWYFQLATNYYVITQPSEPVKVEVAEHRPDEFFTGWDKAELRGPLSLAQAVQKIEEKYGVRVEMIMHGDNVIYGLTPTQEEDRAKKLEVFVAEKTHTAVPPHKHSIRLDLLCKDAEGRIVNTPVVKYFLA